MESAPPVISFAMVVMVRPFLWLVGCTSRPGRADRTTTGLLDRLRAGEENDDHTPRTIALFRSLVRHDHAFAERFARAAGNRGRPALAA